MNICIYLICEFVWVKQQQKKINEKDSKQQNIY